MCVETVENPVYGVRVRTTDGLDVYLKNTLGKRIQAPLFADRFHHEGGDQHSDESLRRQLLPIVGLSDQRGSRVVPLDRRMDTLAFSVISGDLSARIANLHASFAYDE